MNPNKTTIFVISNEPWGPQWFVKHHYANELSKLGFDVYFIDPVGPWRFSNLFSKKVVISEISKNLKVANYQNMFPVRIWPIAMQWLNDRMNYLKLKNLREGNRLVIWQFDTFRFTFNFFENSTKIYHIADHYHDLPFDLANIKNSDLLVCIGESMLKHYTSFNKPIVHIPHAISEDEFFTDQTRVEELKEKYGDYILHAGTVNDRLDLNLLRKILQANNRTNVVFIGPDKLNDQSNVALFEECLNMANFHFLGPVEGSQVKNYVQASKVCLVLYDFDSAQTIGTVTSSLKVLNYLAQKKPIITSIEIEYPQLREKAIFYASNETDFLSQLEEAISNSLIVDRQLVDSYLADKSYKSFIRKIFKKLEG